MREEERMDVRLEYHKGFLCVLFDRRAKIVTAAGPVRIRKWFPVSEAAQQEVAGLEGRPLRLVDEGAGLFVDEDGQAFRLLHGAETEPVEVEMVRASAGTGFSGNGAVTPASAAMPNGPLLLTYRGQDALPESHTSAAGNHDQPAFSDQDSGTRAELATFGVGALPQPVSQPLTLKQKLAEVRRRIGQIEKRGINQEGGYNYVRAADLSGAVGDVLAELGVIMLPRLESISSEPLGADHTDGEHLTRVVIEYCFMDANSAEELSVKVAGEGADPGDKAVCKAQTSALKYALLQSFLIATGDDPEEDSGKSRDRGKQSSRNGRRGHITTAQAQEIRSLIDETGTELEKVLEHFHVRSIAEMNDGNYRKALTVLHKKRDKAAAQEAHAAA